MNIKFIEIDNNIIPITKINSIKFQNTNNGNVKIAIWANGYIYESKSMSLREAKTWLRFRLNIIWENENV